MNKLFPTICIVLILMWWAWALIYSSQPEEFLSTTYSIEDMTDEVKEVSASLLELKNFKQQCKDNLTEYQTVAEYKWIQFFCSENDAEIESLKNRLASMLTMPYEQLDDHLNLTQQEKKIEHLSGVVASGSWSLQALMDFLQAE